MRWPRSGLISEPSRSASEWKSDTYTGWTSGGHDGIGIRYRKRKVVLIDTTTQRMGTRDAVTSTDG